MAVAAVVMASACVQQPAAQTAVAATEPAPVAEAAVSPRTPAAKPKANARASDDAVTAGRREVSQLLALGCTQTAECATVGVGARSCGGPEVFLAYSLRDTPAAALQAAVQRHATLRRKQLEERGEMSTCDVLPDPGAQCAAPGQCQLRPQRGGASGTLMR